jgi:hypothetical protein
MAASQVKFRSRNPTAVRPPLGLIVSSFAQVEALRKAYADVMLNMAQESAARVLAAERRAATLAAGLAAAKKDGVATLVRLKAVMDARVRPVLLSSPFKFRFGGKFARWP